MLFKILHCTGITACLVLIIACFLPWTYHADINQTFTGLYSFKNEYGKPGKFLIPLSSIILICMFFSRTWAKRLNLFLCALVLAYAFKTYVLFSSCYNSYCPKKLAALYLMISSSVIMMIASVFPNVKLKNTT